MKVVLIISGIAASLWLLHRFRIALEDAGYLYYRKGGGGGGIPGAMSELDKLSRPSVQHVIETQEETRLAEDEIGGQ